MVGADLGRSLAAGAELRGPLPKRLETALLFDGHELTVGYEPVLVGLDKVIEIGRLIGSKALSGAVEPVFGMLAALAAGMMQGALPGMMAFCAGAMMQVVFAEMAPQAAKSRAGLFALMTGYALMMALDLALG